jgi:hypothetical protein
MRTALADAEKQLREVLLLNAEKRRCAMSRRTLQPTPRSTERIAERMRREQSLARRPPSTSALYATELWQLRDAGVRRIVVGGARRLSLPENLAALGERRNEASVRHWRPIF